MKRFIKGIAKFALCLTIVFMTLSIGLATKSPSNYVYAAEGDVEINATTFPDAKFRDWVKTNITSGSDTLTATMIANTKDINVNSKQIADLTGIEYFTALKTLDCGYNQLTALDVSKNMLLEGLSCFNNQLATLDVSNNTSLTTLWCSNNQLTTLDVSNNTALTKLICSASQLTTLDVGKNIKLTILWCSNNQLTTLDVSNNTALLGLWCEANKLTTLDVSKNTALQALVCDINQLTALDLSKQSATIDTVLNDEIQQAPAYIAKQVGNKYVVNLKQNDTKLNTAKIVNLVSNGTYDAVAATVTYDSKPAATEKISYSYDTDSLNQNTEDMKVEGSVTVEVGSVTNTADSNLVWFYTLLFVVSLIGVSGMIVYSKRKN